MIMFDTNIFIRVMRDKNEKVMRQIAVIGEENIALNPITLAEMYYGAFNKRELNAIKSALSSYFVYHFEEKASVLFIDLMLRYGVSHRLKIPDAMIAAICIANGIELYTEKIKDFEFIPEMKLYKPK